MSWHNGSGDKKDANFVLLHKQPGNAHFLDEQDENDVFSTKLCLCLSLD